MAACKGASELISTPVAGPRRVLNGCAVFGAWLGRRCGQNAFFRRKPTETISQGRRFFSLSPAAKPRGRENPPKPRKFFGIFDHNPYLGRVLWGRILPKTTPQFHQIRVSKKLWPLYGSPLSPLMPGSQTAKTKTAKRDQKWPENVQKSSQASPAPGAPPLGLPPGGGEKALPSRMENVLWTNSYDFSADVCQVGPSQMAHAVTKVPHW